MATKISTGTPIKIQDSSNGIINFLVSYGDENKTPCPRNYVNGKLLSGTGNNATYIYSNQLSAISSFVGDKWYTVGQTWSEFCKNSYPVTSSDLIKLSSSNIANWKDFKNIVINSFIPLTNIRYCKFTKYTNLNGSATASTTYANIFLTDVSIKGNHTAFKDLFMNNTRQEGKKVITTSSDFIHYGGIEEELNTISENAGEGKVIKSGWNGSGDESLNKLLSCCVKALNKIRIDLSCTFTDDIYNLRYKILLHNYITNLTSAITVLQSVNSNTYTLPTYQQSPLSNYILSANYTFDKWMINNTTLSNAGEILTFSQTSLPSSFTIRPRLKYVVTNKNPTFISHTGGNGIGGDEGDRFDSNITLGGWFNRSGKVNTYYNNNKSRLAGIRFGDKLVSNWSGSGDYTDQYTTCRVTIDGISQYAKDHIGVVTDENGGKVPKTTRSSQEFGIVFVPSVTIDGKALNAIWSNLNTLVQNELFNGVGGSITPSFININNSLTTSDIDNIKFDIIELDGGHWRFLELVYIDIESSATINYIVI